MFWVLIRCCLHWRIVKMANVCTKTESNYADLLARPTKDEYWAKHVHVRCNKHSLRMATCHKQSRTTAHSTHTHIYLRMYYVCTCVCVPNKKAGLKQALVFMAQLPLAGRQPGNQSYTHNFPYPLHTLTHTHTRRVGQYLRSAVVTRRRSGNVAEIASRPLRSGIEQ